MPRELNPGEAMSPREDHLAKALGYELKHTQASSRLGHLIRYALRDIFGDGLAGALERPHEEMSEYAGEALWHYGRAVEGRDMDIATLKSEVARLHRECLDVKTTLLHVAERLLEHYKTSLLIDDVDQILVMAAAKLGVDWIFPPNNPAHAHVIRQGRCLNPACSWRPSDEEPF